jgi:hypothetical protein
MYVCYNIYIYVCVCVCVCVYIYIYIYIGSRLLAVDGKEVTGNAIKDIREMCLGPIGTKTVRVDFSICFLSLKTVFIFLIRKIDIFLYQLYIQKI